MKSVRDKDMFASVHFSCQYLGMLAFQSDFSVAHVVDISRSENESKEDGKARKGKNKKGTWIVRKRETQWPHLESIHDSLPQSNLNFPRQAKVQSDKSDYSEIKGEAGGEKVLVLTANTTEEIDN
jgi:hypothetical protein